MILGLGRTAETYRISTVPEPWRVTMQHAHPHGSATMTTDTEAVTKAADAALLRLLLPPFPLDPYSYYAVLRAIAPVHLASFGGAPICFMSSYAACAQVLASPDLGVQDASWFDANYLGWREGPATRTLYQGVQNSNGTDHTRMRRVLGACFSRGRLARLRDRVGELADQYLDVLADAGSDGGTIELISMFAIPLPATVISEMLGVPEADRPEFNEIGGRIFNLTDLFVTDEDRRIADEAAARLREYWTALVRERRRTPCDDVTSELTAAADAGQLSEEELVATLVFLFAAGFGTTASLVGNATAALLADPGLAARLCADAGLAPAVVEESLRHEAPTLIDPRLTVRSVTIDGVRLEPGQLVIALLGAGNRDPDQFPDPDRFDVDRFRGERQGNRVLSFGGGIHQCLGAPLSRMEASVLLPRLVTRFPGLVLAAEPERTPAARMRMYARLPVALGPLR
jgi:cytochrome P450